MRFPKAIGLAAVLALATVRCQGDATEPAVIGGSSRILLTDAPFPFQRVSRVDLYVVSVAASVSADTGATAGGNFVTVASPNRRINVLALQNGLTDELGTASLPPGAIKAMRLVIDTDSSSITLRNGTVLTGRSTPGIHWQSSAGRPTLDALIHEQILVPDTGAVAVIDFDVGKAFIPPQEVDPASTDSGFIFSPVVRAADATRTGAITGTVRARSAAGTPVADASLRLYLGSPGTPENTWSALATARSDANGAFRFAFVTRSAYWSTIPALTGKTYIVAVDPPPGAGVGRMLVPSVVVGARAETALGTIVLP